MRRWIGTMLAALLVAAPLVAVDKSTDEKGNDRATQLKNLQTDYRKVLTEAQKAFQAAKTAKERETVREAVLEKLNKDFAPRILKLVEADPKDKSSFDALMWAVQALPNVDRKVFDLLAENRAKDAQIKNLCLVLMQQPNEGAAKLLHKVIDENKEKDAQGFACFALAKLSNDESEKKGDRKAAEEAEKLYERIGKEFAEVKTGRGTLGDQAKSSLSEIRARGVGKKMPNLESEDVDGKKVQLKDYKGKVVVLDIWATWCPPCKEMIPDERKMVEKLKSKPFTLISISADAKKETLKDFLDSNKMPWVHWWNGQSGGVLEKLKVQFFPTIYVLDGEGVIRYKNIRKKELEDAVEKLLAETKDKK